jgi:hypothetical protein
MVLGCLMSLWLLLVVHGHARISVVLLSL